MNSLLKMHIMENHDSPVEKIEEVDPSQLPDIEAGFNEAVEVDTDVETHAVNLESLEDVISDVKDVVEQQKINLAEMKDDADISDGQDDSGDSEQAGGDGSSGGEEGGDGSVEGDNVGGDGSSESSSDGVDGDVSSEGGDVSSDSSDAGGDSSGDIGGDSSDVGEESSDSGDGSDGSSDSGESSGDETSTEESDSGDSGAESQDSGEGSGDEDSSESSEGDSDNSEGNEETPEPELDKDSSEEDVDKQIAQESLLLANCSGRVGVPMSIKNPSLENFYSQLGLSKKTCNLESNMDRKTRNYLKYKTHHESFLDVLDRFAVAAKEGIAILIKKIIQLYQSIVNNFKKIFDTTKTEIKIAKDISSSGMIDVPGKGKIPLKDIEVVIAPDSNIDVNILAGINYSKLMSNEEILIENIIKASTDFRQEGYIPNDQWAQQVLKLLLESGLSDIGYGKTNKDIFFIGSGVGYEIRVSKFGPYVLDTVTPELETNTFKGDKLMECVEFALETLPIVNNPHHKSLIEEGLKFLNALVNDTNHIYGSRELIMLLRGIQSRQLSTIRAARQLRALLIESAKNQAND